MKQAGFVPEVKSEERTDDEKGESIENNHLACAR